MNYHILLTYRFFSVICCLFFLLFCGCEKETIGHKEEEVCFNLELTANSNFNIVTRTAVSDSSFAVPEAEDFKIQIFNTAGELLKEWGTYSQVPHPVKIQTGRFQIKASHGNPEKSGFECPAFAGDTTVQLLSASANKGIRENRIALSAKFANVLASVRYRESLKTHYEDYNTQIITSHDTITFNKDEERIAFFPVEDLKVVVNLTKHDSTTYSIPATTLTQTKAAEFYRLYVDVEGGSGYEKLLLSFDSTTIENPIEIELSQNWQSRKIPYLSPSFDTTKYHSFIMGEDCEEGTFYTLITAVGKIGSCKIKTNSRSLINAGWPAEVDLLNLTSANRDRLEKFGFTWPKNMANVNMAELDFSGIVSHLPSADHVLTVEVADIYGQVSALLPIRFRIIPPEFKLLPPEQPAIIRSLEYAFEIQMNGGNPDNIIIEYLNNYPEFGVTEWTPCEIRSREWNDTQDKVLLHTKINMNKTSIQFRAKYDKKITDEVTLQAVNPTFRLQKDGPEWAKRAYLNIEQTDGTNGLANNTLKEHYKVQISTDKNTWTNTDADADSLSFDTKHDLIKFQVNKLESNHTYYVRVAFDAKMNLGICYSEPLEIKTEEELELPEIRFNRDKKINVQKGGRYGKKGLFSESWADYEYTNVFYYENESSPWENVNLKTIPRSPGNKNSWYMVASTLPEDNGVLLRNVGWDNNGTKVSEDKSKRSLSELPAPAIGQYSAGKLFLGPNESTSNYSYDHSDPTKETYNEGYPFTSRPLKLSFSYTYKEVVNKDNAFVKIEVLDANNHTIGTGEATFESQETLTSTSVTITYTDTQIKAAKLKIMFASSSSCSYDQSEEKTNIEKFTTPKEADAIRTGSKFFITNISLDYE